MRSKMNIDSTLLPSTTISTTHAMHNLLKLAVLLNLVNPGKLFESCHSSSVDEPRPPVSRWHRFLDEFAWLGDTRKGGDTVTAVTGLMISGQPTLLLASNYGVRPEVDAHLQLVLRLLQSLAGSDDKDRQRIQQQILEASVSLSRDRVQNYSIRLMKAAACIIPFSTTLTPDDNSSLHAVLADIKSLSKDHLALCDWAYNLTKSKILSSLDQKCNIQPKVPAFHRVRHYIGRLGAWHRAAQVVTQIALEAPELIAGLTLKIIPPRPLLCRPPQVDGDTLHSLIGDLRLELDVCKVLEKLQALYDMARGNHKDTPTDIREAFCKRLMDPAMKPIVHAEVLLTEYIFDSNLCFFQDDRYIGCSKPSCVSCHLYLGAHPLNLVPCRCHGNLWPKWCWPCSVSPNVSSHVMSLLCFMFSDFRWMLLDRLTNGRTIIQRLPDSVTGITQSTADGEKL